MLKSSEDISPTKKRLSIEIPSDVIEKEIENSLEKLRQKTKIPGFRPGKAPVNLIEKRFGKEVEAEVLERVIPEYYNKALREAELMPVTTPVFDERVDFKRNNPLNLSLTVEVMPRIENLTYENIKIEDIPVSVDDSEMEVALKKLQEEKAIYEVAEKEIGMDDIVTFDYVDCEIVRGENNLSVKEEILKMGNEIFPPEMIEKAIGKKKGEVMEFTTTFDENFKSKELADKTVNLKVMIKEIKQKVLPAIDDEFAKDLGFENISALKERIKENIYKAKKEQVVKIQKAELVKKIIESHNFEVPETLFRNELESLIMEESMSDAEYGKQMHDTGYQIHDNQVSGIRDRQSEAELKRRALRNVQASIIIDAIGKKEGIMVTDDEVRERILSIAQRLQATPEAVTNLYISRDGSLKGLRHSIYEDKVMDMLLSKAIIEQPEAAEKGE
ncbi:MAG: trigger factor [Nitrospirota bacterium]